MATRTATVRRAARGRPLSGVQFVLWLVNGLICLFLLAPILVVVVASFSAGAYLVFPPRELSLRWYGEFFKSRDFTDALQMSLQLGVLTTVISTVIGLLASLALAAAKFRGAELLRALVVAPLTVPGIVAGIAMLIYFNRIQMGGSFISLLLAHVAITLPFVVRIVSSGLQSFDRSIEEAAMSLGASRTTAFLTITLPLIKGSALAAAIFAFIISFDEVVVTLFLAGPKLTTLPVKIYTYIENNSDPLIAAVSTILVVLAALVVMVVDRFVGFTRFL
jgi:putative spermidine/putrescine transport system permease protein